VENAIKHGVERITGPGIIRITAERENGMNGASAELVLCVHDNGPGLGGGATDGREGAGGERAGGVGLRNSIARLEQLYGSAQRFRLAPDARGGSVAEVRLPYHLEPGDRTHGG
jgi:sensor histidine kinase YesM